MGGAPFSNHSCRSLPILGSSGLQYWLILNRTEAHYSTLRTCRQCRSLCMVCWSETWYLGRWDIYNKFQWRWRLQCLRTRPSRCTKMHPVNNPNLSLTFILIITSPHKFFIIPTGPDPYFSGDVSLKNFHWGTNFFTMYWGFWVDMVLSEKKTLSWKAYDAMINVQCCPWRSIPHVHL